MKAPIKILIADDHPILTAGIRMTLEQWEDFEPVGVAYNGQEAVELCRRTKPDIVIMDMQMPKLSGGEAILKIKKELPRVKVLAFTTFDDPDTVSGAMEAGCDGFLLKVIEPERLRTSLLSIVDGINVYDEGAMANLRHSMKNKADIDFSDRETEIIRSISRGKTNGEIAESMGLRPGTVKNMVSLLLNKTGCISRSQLARYAAEQGIV